jgi:PEP-CTERM motif
VVAAPGLEGTVSYAVISGASFNSEVVAHAIGFGGSVPSGTLGPVVLPAPTDFVYLYQLVNDGPSPDLILNWDITGGLVGLGPGITAGTRLESTLFVDTSIFGLVSAGPFGATTGLSVSGLVDFENGLGDPQPVPVPPWGPCLGSAGTADCSDGQADLFPTSVTVSNWQEAPSAFPLDPGWSGTVVWFASPFGPGNGSTTITEISGFSTSGFVPVPVPEPGTLLLLGSGLMGLVFYGREKRTR